MREACRSELGNRHSGASLEPPNASATVRGGAEAGLQRQSRGWWGSAFWSFRPDLNLFFHASVIPPSTLFFQDLDRLPGPCASIAFTFSYLPTPAVERDRPAFCFTPQHQKSLPARSLRNRCQAFLGTSDKPPAQGARPCPSPSRSWTQPSEPSMKAAASR